MEQDGENVNDDDLVSGGTQLQPPSIPEGKQKENSQVTWIWVKGNNLWVEWFVKTIE